MQPAGLPANGAFDTDSGVAGQGGFWGPGFWNGLTSGFYENAFWEAGFWEGLWTTTGVQTAHWAIQAELSGRGNGWTDLTYDVRSEQGVSAEYGIQGVTATDRVASTGTMTFTLNNGPTNRARTTGYYAPDNANVRTGFMIGIRVRLALTYVPVGTVYKFLGTLDSVTPTPGVRGSYLSKCTAVDWMDEAANFYVTGLAVETSVRGDQVFNTVIATMPVQPASISTTAGLDTYPYALDNVQDEQTTVLQILQNLALSELGYIYVRSDQMQGGTLVYESRSVRGALTSTVQSFSNDMEVLTPTRSRQNFLNKIQVTAHPRKVDATNNTVLFTLNSVPSVSPGQTTQINGPFRDPNQPLARVGGINLQNPVAETDYVILDAATSSGNDITSNFSVTLDPVTSGNSATFDITNNGGVNGFVNKLQVRGQGIYDYNTVILTSQDTNSQAISGQRVLNLDMPYQADPAVASEAAQYVLNVWNASLSYITKLTIVGNWSDDLMRAVLLRDISDKISIGETITGLATTTNYFVNAVKIEIGQGRTFRASLTLAPADQNSYWLLEVPGQGELDLVTRLGYGLIVGHTDVLHGDTHGDMAHVDNAHVDTHSDVAHGDVAHSDSTGHGDSSSHTDIAHSDSSHNDSHTDTAHVDIAHTDTAHNDSHSDVSHGDTHADHDDHGDHDDVESPHQHSDVDSHNDSHNDTAHDDTHADDAHGDVAHDDEAHNDTHGDANHGDVAHQDTSSHDDSSGHSDIAHTDVTHVDTHTDTAHQDTAHSDSHTDTAHGDIN